MPQVKAYRKIQTRLVGELEKKVNDKPVVFIVQRRILPKPTRKSKKLDTQRRLRSTALIALREALLEDLCSKAETVWQAFPARWL